MRWVLAEGGWEGDEAEYRHANGQDAEGEGRDNSKLFGEGKLEIADDDYR